MTVDPKVLRMVQALSSAGFTGAALTAMTALGISESGGDPNVINNTPATGDYSVGAFQINYYGDLAPSRTAQFGPPSQLVGNIDKQAKAAFVLSGGGANFNPWKSDYSNGSYYQNLPAATEAVNAFNGGAVAPLAQGSPGSGVTLMSTVNSGRCLISFPSLTLPSQSLPLVGNVGGGDIGGGCMLSLSQAKHIGGGLLMIAGVLVAIVGIVMIVKEETNPQKALGSLVGNGSQQVNPAKTDTNETDIISDREYDKRTGGKSDIQLKEDATQLKKSKKAHDKRNTFDARSGKNYMGETQDEVPF